MSKDKPTITSDPHSYVVAVYDEHQYLCATIILHGQIDERSWSERLEEIKHLMAEAEIVDE